jgi:hypothetical protein
MSQQKLDSRRQQKTAVYSKNKSPNAPRDGSGGRQQQHRLYEVRIESFRQLSQFIRE